MMAKPRKKTASKASKPVATVVLPRGVDGGRITVVTAQEPKRSWLSRLLVANPKPKAPKVDAGQMAALRDSVMQEYRARAA